MANPGNEDKMIDLHSHVLYGLDDGAENAEMTLGMLRIAQEEGIGAMVATPHFIRGENCYDAALLDERFKQAVCLAKEHCIKIELHPGNEMFLDEYALDSLRSNQCRALAGSRYVLVELPAAGFSRHVEGILYNMLVSGYIPVLAHVERYEEIRKEPGILKRFLEMGCVSQLNAMSITGGAGKKAWKAARAILKNNMGHLVATDSHTDRVRAPRLKEARRIVRKWIGDEMAECIFHKNPQAILRDELFQVCEPVAPKKRWFLTGRPV